MADGTAALIVAAGRGTRLGADRPKQYLRIGGDSILARSVRRFLTLSEIDTVRVVIADGDEDLYANATSDIQDDRLLRPVTGGESRSASVRSGLASLEDRGPRVVLIHDAARPFVPLDVIRAVIRALDDCDGAFAALPVVDALWRAEGDRAAQPLDRRDLWRAQTPQGFHLAAILAAYADYDGDAADDVEIAHAAGLDVRIVPGDEANFKITTEADLARARDLAETRGWRTQ